jgi:hypothetical protein
MKQIHLIMPFMRNENKEKLLDAYRSMGVVLHPIMFLDERIEFPDESWLVPSYIPMYAQDCKALMPGSFKRNYWIQHNDIIADDYYVTVDDDDMYEANVFNEIKKMDDDIIIISMKRGYRIPMGVIDVRKYPTTTLIADENNIRIGEISAQQSFVKGKIFKKHLFNESSHTWDGEIIVHHKASEEQIAYRPDLFALFNYYEPGRWEKSKVSFGVLVNDLMRLDMVFRQSQIDISIPCNTIKMPETACKGLNKLLTIMESEGNEIGILSHQDMFYRSGWLEQVQEKILELPESWIVAGIIGKDMEGRICGRLHDMRMPLHFSTNHKYPHPASCFDECCIIVNLKKGFRFDEAMPRFDLYGTQAVLIAKEMGGTAWIIDAFAEHYCMRSFTWYPDGCFEACYKWIHDRFPNADRIDSTVIGVPKEKEQAA